MNENRNGMIVRPMPEQGKGRGTGQGFCGEEERASTTYPTARKEIGAIRPCASSLRGRRGLRRGNDRTKEIGAWTHPRKQMGSSPGLPATRTS